MHLHFCKNLPSMFWHSALEDCLQKKEKNYVKPEILNLENKSKSLLQLEALGRRRSPWPRQIIDCSHIVKMLSLGDERLTPKGLDRYLHHNLVLLPLLWCFWLIYSS